MIGGLQGDFGNLDNKYLKQNISKCRSEISGSFRRTPRHCILRENSPGKHYQRIRICLIGQNSGCVVRRRWNVVRTKFFPQVEWVMSQGGPSACARCMDPFPGWHGVRKAIRIKSIRIPQEDTRCSWTSHPEDSISYPDMLSESLTSAAILSGHLLLLTFRICLWQRTSKLWFFMFLSSPLLCHGFQRTLLNHGLLWWSKSYQNTKT